MTGTQGTRGMQGVQGLRAMVTIGRRSDASVGLAIVVMLTAVAAMIGVAPRLLEHAEASSLDQAVAEAPPVLRRLSVRAIEDFPPGFDDDPLETPRAVVERAAESVPDAVSASFGAPRLVVDSNRFRVTFVEDVAPSSPTFLTFRAQTELADHSRIVEGRAAQRSLETIDDERVFEFELSTVAADVMGLAVGDRLAVVADTGDAVTRRYIGGLPDPFVAVLVGLRELDDPSDPYWFGDARLHRPTVADTGLGANFFVHGSIAIDALPVRPYMIDLRSPMLVEQRRDLTPGAVTVDNVDVLLDGLVTLEASSVAPPTAGRPGIVVGLRRVLIAEIDQRTVARSTLVLAAVGVVAVALVALAQLLHVAFGRRRSWLAVARARGATPRQVIATTAFEVGVIATVSVLVGSVAARLLVDGSGSATELRLLAGLWVGAVVTAALLAAAEVRRPIDTSGRAGSTPGLGKWGRVGGGLLVAVVLGGLITFRRRGLELDTGTIDVLAVLVPVLVPLAVVFLTRWVLPVGLRVIGRAGLVLGPGRLVGVRRAIADPGAGAGLIAVLALALTVAGLGLGVNRSLERGITDASWNEVGAPYRIDTRDPDVVAAVAAVPGIELAAYGDNQFRFQQGGDVVSGRLINVETGEIDRLTDATAADLTLPESIRSPDTTGRVPVVASTRLGGQRIRRGDSVRGTGSFEAVEFVVVETRAEAFGHERDWVIADRGVFEAASGRAAPTSSLLFDIPARSRAVVDALAADEGLAVEDRASIERGQRDDPLVRIVRGGYLAAGLAATALALLGVGGLAVVTARQRRREVSVLGLLGASRREIARAVRAELIAPVVAGVLLGTGLGWAMTSTFDGRFDVSPFANGTPVAMRPDAVGQLLTGAVVAAAAFAVVAVLVHRIVRVRVDDVLRVDGSA